MMETNHWNTKECMYPNTVRIVLYIWNFNFLLYENFEYYQERNIDEFHVK